MTYSLNKFDIEELRNRVLKRMLERSNDAIALVILMNGLSLLREMSVLQSNMAAGSPHKIQDISSFEGYVTLADAAQTLIINDPINTQKLSAILGETLEILSFLVHSKVSAPIRDILRPGNNMGIFDIKTRIFLDVKAMLNVANTDRDNGPQDHIFLYWDESGDTMKRRASTPSPLPLNWKST